MKKKGRRSFSQEFKQEAVVLVNRVGITEASRQLEVQSSVLRSWKKKIEGAETPTAQSGKKSYAELEKEVRRLAKENGYLKEINRVLKKSTAIFSADHMGSLK